MGTLSGYPGKRGLKLFVTTGGQAPAGQGFMESYIKKSSRIWAMM